VGGFVHCDKLGHVTFSELGGFLFLVWKLNPFSRLNGDTYSVY